MKYFLWFLVSIGLIVITFILIFHTFSGGSKTAPAPLVNYSNTDTTVQFTEHGPLVADQNYEGFSINIGASENVINVLQGYNDTITSSKIYNNNESAYAVFLRAIDLDGFQKGSTSTSKTDSRGYCATGERYTFEIVSGGGDAQNYWSTSCGQGNFGGNVSSIAALFENQIPDFTTVTQNVNF